MSGPRTSSSTPRYVFYLCDNAVDAPPGSLGLTLGWANTDFASVVAVAAKSRLYGVVCVGDALQGVDGVEFFDPRDGKSE